jgi:DnaJ-class molecular chaperone
LSDPEKRQLYDEYGEEGVQNGGPPGAGGGSFFDFFNAKQSDNRPKKMKPKLINL